MAVIQSMTEVEFAEAVEVISIEESINMGDAAIISGSVNSERIILVATMGGKHAKISIG